MNLCNKNTACHFLFREAPFMWVRGFCGGPCMRTARVFCSLLLRAGNSGCGLGIFWCMCGEWSGGPILSGKGWPLLPGHSTYFCRTFPLLWPARVKTRESNHWYSLEYICKTGLIGWRPLHWWQDSSVDRRAVWWWLCVAYSLLDCLDTLTPRAYFSAFF